MNTLLALRKPPADRLHSRLAGVVDSAGQGIDPTGRCGTVPN
jgi:hypothetical protein